MQRRNTKNKEQILGVFKGRHALTVQEMCQLLPEIEVSVVYRNIERFVADGVLREVDTHASSIAYELAETVHDHFVCDDCHEIEDIHIRSAPVKKMLPKGVQMRAGGVVVHGVCKQCSA